MPPISQIALGLLLAVSVAACGGSPDGATDGTTDETADESGRFANISADFVGDEACFDCHEAEYRGFQEHGMANSLFPLTPENVVEDFSDATVHDEAGDLTYRMYREGDRFFQEEYRIGPDGDKIHSLVREMQYVVGSGTAARSYLVEENDHYYELPVTWYTQSGRWAFSPGYETFNARFDRLIPDRCMTCHNSYPDPVPFAEGKFVTVPMGIGCERCHGPGSVHVDARLAAPQPADSMDATIVNPAHLSLERRLDVCQQCHLHSTVSVLREGRTAYNYRPSQPLSDYVAFFASDAPSADDAIDVISHADRMKQSACFLGTQSWEQPMDCTTCHDPHEGFRTSGPDYFNRTCITCHNVSDLAAAMPTAQSAAVHVPTANCFSCHMPKVEAEGTPHASFTDHDIRVVTETVAPPVPARSAVGLQPYFARDEADGVYAGMAYVVYGRQQGDTTALRRGIEVLTEALDGREEHGEAHFLLGLAHVQLGQVDDAVPALEAAVTADPNVPERLNALAQAYEADGRSAEAVERLYARALDIQPALVDVRINYGRFLETQGRLQEALAQYRRAVGEEPWLETAHFNLGTALLRAGDLEDGEASLREAVHLRPDYGQALSNLGLLLAGQGRTNEARAFFERAVRADPESPLALGNLGAFHLNAGTLQEAVNLLERAVERDRNYVDGLVNLALAYFRMEDYASARLYAERALQIDPNQPLAQQILGAL